MLVSVARSAVNWEAGASSPPENYYIFKKTFVGFPWQSHSSIAP